MTSRFTNLRDELKGEFFLSSMMNVTDGAFCSQRGKGCAMVQLGAYLAEPPAYGKEPYFLPADPERCTRFLAEEDERARVGLDARTCLNLASPKLEWGLEGANCFFRAGGDVVELNVHGGYERYLRLGKLRAMVLPENRSELFRWIEAFTRLEIPLIVKFRQGIVDDYAEILANLADNRVFGVHFNVRDARTGRPDFDFVRGIRRNCPFFLLVSGYVRSAEDAETLFELGADMVGIAEPTIEDRGYIRQIAEGSPQIQ